MNTEVLTAVVASIGVIIAALTNKSFKRNPRDDIERDIKIAKELEDSKTKRHLQGSINRRVTQLANSEAGTRDTFGAVLALVLFGLFGWMAILAGRAGGWWWFASIPLTALALVMIPLGLRDLSKRQRDEDK